MCINVLTIEWNIRNVAFSKKIDINFDLKFLLQLERVNLSAAQTLRAAFIKVRHKYLIVIIRMYVIHKSKCQLIIARLFPSNNPFNYLVPVLVYSVKINTLPKSELRQVLFPENLSFHLVLLKLTLEYSLFNFGVDF